MSCRLCCEELTVLPSLKPRPSYKGSTEPARCTNLAPRQDSDPQSTKFPGENREKRAPHLSGE